MQRRGDRGERLLRLLGLDEQSLETILRLFKQLAR